MREYCQLFIEIVLATHAVTRTAWAVFKYCGTKTVTLKMKKKYEKIDLKLITKETNKIRGNNQI